MFSHTYKFSYFWNSLNIVGDPLNLSKIIVITNKTFSKNRKSPRRSELLKCKIMCINRFPVDDLLCRVVGVGDWLLELLLVLRPLDLWLDAGISKILVLLRKINFLVPESPVYNKQAQFVLKWDINLWLLFKVQNYFRFSHNFFTYLEH